MTGPQGMGVTHPIGDDLLMGYAAGRLPAALDLLVAAAASLDDDARARLAGFEELGGALLALQQVAPLRDDSFEAVMERIRSAPPEETVAPDRKAPRAGAVLPGPLREAAGGDVADLPWRAAGGGARVHALDGADGGADGAEGMARLVSIPPGAAMPRDGHGGPQVTLVLSGALRDRGARYARGDVAVAGAAGDGAGDGAAPDAASDGAPVAEPGADCICLVVANAPARMRALLPRLAQRFLDV